MRLFDQLTDFEVSRATQSVIMQDNVGESEAAAKLSYLAFSILMRGVRENAASAHGAAALAGALQEGGEADPAADEDGEPDREGILNLILGDRRDAAEKALSDAGNIDRSDAARLLACAAPAALAALASAMREKNVNSSALAQFLNGEARR